MQTIAAQQAAGNTIPYVTVSLGANDLYGLVSNPSFFTFTAAQQQAQVLAVLGTVQSNYTNLLFELKSLLPNAQIVLVGYYNPFAALTGTPVAAVAPLAVQGLNSVIAGEAAAFVGVSYIDTYSAFLGKEAADTYITTLAFGSPNIHPTAAGYQIIEQQLSVVPEPGSFCLMGLGIVALTAGALRRRRGLDRVALKPGFLREAGFLRALRFCQEVAGGSVSSAFKADWARRIIRITSSPALIGNSSIPGYWRALTRKISSANACPISFTPRKSKNTSLNRSMTRKYRLCLRSRNEVLFAIFCQTQRDLGFGEP